MARWLHHDRMLVLFTRALEAGAVRTGMVSARWDISGNCRSPYTTEIRGRPATEGAKMVIIGPGTKVSYFLEILTRCRHCDKCLRHRAYKWRTRALEEVRLSSRTWFGTLTVSPENHFLALSRCRLKASRSGVDFDRLPERERWLRLVSEHGKDLTKYVKRLRKNSQVAIRYLVIAERHKSGLPHFHMLVHERGEEIKHKMLSEQWKLGFEKWRLTSALEPQQALYLCKYLSKSLDARVRASQGYGQGLRSWIITQLELLGVND